MSGLDDLSKSIGAGSSAAVAIGDLLGGLGGGGLGGVLGGILGRRGARAAAGSAAATRCCGCCCRWSRRCSMNGGLQKILGRLQAERQGREGTVLGVEGRERAGRREPTSARRSTTRSSTRIAQQLGVSKDEAAEAVAQVLPDVVDQATPEGELPDERASSTRSSDACTSWTARPTR